MTCQHTNLHGSEAGRYGCLHPGALAMPDRRSIAPIGGGGVLCSTDTGGDKVK